MGKIIKKPWGLEEILYRSETWTVKRIHIKKGHKTSLQYHKKKREWMFYENGIQSYIGPKFEHRLCGPAEIIEVSDSGYEGDIIRMRDLYKRALKDG